MRIYIAHPYTGDEERNRERALKAEEVLRRTTPNVEFFNPVGRMSEQFEGLSYVAAMNRCLAELASCDGIVICSGWENSPGCRIEARTARELQLPRWYGTGDYGISWGRVERNAQQRERAL